jgi:hypothetical protein
MHSAMFSRSLLVMRMALMEDFLGIGGYRIT